MTTKNIGKQQQIGLDAIFSKRVASWWQFSANAGLYYFMNKLDYETYKQEYKRPSCFLSATNSISCLPISPLKYQEGTIRSDKVEAMK